MNALNKDMGILHHIMRFWIAVLFAASGTNAAFGTSAFESDFELAAGNNNYFAGVLETLVHNCGPDELLTKYPGATRNGDTITTPDGKTFHNDGTGNFTAPNRVSV